MRFGSSLVLLLLVPTLASAQPAASPASPSADVLKKQFAARLEQNVQPTASTIKIAILYELIKQAEEGKLKLDDVRPLDRKKAVEGSGVLFNLGTPSLALRDYAMLMIILSDNTATNVLMDVVGMEAVTARMRSLGLKDTKLRRHMLDGAAARRGDENVSSADEIARLFETFYRGTGLSPQSRDEALRILKTRNESKSTPVIRAIPETVDIASKPGELEGVRVDSGIVFVENRPYIISVMATYLQDDDAGNKAIEDLARVAYGYFSRLAAGTEYGRQIGRN
ncbi:MAG TPA: serine hydrolase [Vicinamibacterales bacterium]|jgi:beta-lactamase class A